MTPQEKITVTKALLAIALIVGEEVADARLKAYLIALDDLRAADLVKAIEQLSRTARFFPKPVDIRDLVEGSPDDRGQRAWSGLKKIVATQGNWPSLYCEDAETVKSIVDTFGSWISCGEFLHVCSPEMEASKQKEFLRNYRLASRNPPRQARRYLPGQFETNNRESVSNWRERYRENGHGAYPLEVVRLAANGDYSRYSAPGSIETGELEHSAKLELERGAGITELRLPANPEPKQLNSAPLPDVEPDEVKAGIKSLAREMGTMRPKAGLTDEEHQERLRQLKHQARILTSEEQN